MFKKNLCLTTDSYKVSHWNQFPKGASHSFYYMESRGGVYTEVLSAGFKFAAKVLCNKITEKDVRKARKIYNQHFGKDLFNFDGWMHIVNKYDGILPLKFRSVPEGTVVPVHNVIATIENVDDDKLAWLPGWFEMFLLRCVWYQTTVGTVSYECKKAIIEFFDLTSDLSGTEREMIVKTRLHDFGGRGVSSGEGAGLGGTAHLYNFIGTDTVEALEFSMNLFDLDYVPGVSIPAREHSTTTCYGKDHELDAYLNSIENYGDGIYACVMDSYSYKNAIKLICRDDVKAKIIEAGGCFVARPDSGNMVDNIMFALHELGEAYGYTINSKGYKVLNKHVRIIQGDEIHSHLDIRRVLSWMEANKWSAENVAFGMGGGLLQLPNRDTQKFAMKMSAIKINGVWMKVFKNPEGAEWKRSKKGLLTLIKRDGQYMTIDTLEESFEPHEEVLQDKYVSGELFNEDTLESIRAISDKQSGL